MPRELSGGMQQRASIVRCLSYDPDVILMDEPFGALDAFTRDEMNLLIQKIWMETGKTIVFVTHNVTEAIFLADRVVVLTPRPGRLAHIFPIDLPRPRTIDMTFSPEFIEMVLKVKATIERGVHGNTAAMADVLIWASRAVSTITRPARARRSQMASELRETIPTFNQARGRGRRRSRPHQLVGADQPELRHELGRGRGCIVLVAVVLIGGLGARCPRLRHPELHLSRRRATSARRSVTRLPDLFWPHLQVTLQELFVGLRHRRRDRASSWRR